MLLLSILLFNELFFLDNDANAPDDDDDLKFVFYLVIFVVFYLVVVFVVFYLVFIFVVLLSFLSEIRVLVVLLVTTVGLLLLLL